MIMIAFEVGRDAASLTDTGRLVEGTVRAAPPLMHVVALRADAVSAVAAMLQFVKVFPHLKVATVMTEPPMG